MNGIYIGLVSFFMVFYSCGSGIPKTTSPKTNQKVIKINLDSEVIEECDLYLSFAFANRQTEDHQSAVDNFNYVIKQGCSSLKANDIFEWMGRSYIELAKYDSANWAFREGISYMSDNEQLLEVAAWNAGKIGNTNDQIYYYDKILGVNESNLSALEKLSDLYGENGMYKEQLEILNLWLKIDSGNSKAISDKKSVYSLLGKDEVDVDKERWENDPSNLDYGLDYLKSLREAGLEEELIEFSDRMLVYDRKNKSILEILAETHLNLFNLTEAKGKYLYLYNHVSPDYKYSIEISKILMDETSFEDAYKWADDAILKSNNSGESYFQRAEVLFQTAENCTGDILLFDDKVVYELSVQDYSTAIEKGFDKGESRKEFLEKNNITNQGDWFMRGEDQLKAKPSGSCYSWIDRQISRK